MWVRPGGEPRHHHHCFDVPPVLQMNRPGMPAGWVMAGVPLENTIRGYGLHVC
jgi:hypothetical protein